MNPLFFNGKKKSNLEKKAKDFKETIAKLRGPEGCPWDLKQTTDSLRKYLIEESYEANEAARNFVQNPSPENALSYCDELGDVLLQVFLNAQICEEQGYFSVEDVFDIINEKMIRRHPHVFNNEAQKLETSEEVLTQWAQIKSKEKEKKKTLLGDVERKQFLPTLEFAQKVSQKCHKIGFTYPNIIDCLKDLKSEVVEFEEECLKEEKNYQFLKEEAGDIIYSLANCMEQMNDLLKEDTLKLSLDDSARGSLQKFLERFHLMEELLEKDQKKTEEFTLQDWDVYWKKAKKIQKEKLR